jgi:hypothetical protein
MVDETYEAWVDDGDPAIADPRRNRLTVRRKVFIEDIVVADEREPQVAVPVASAPAVEEVSAVPLAASISPAPKRRPSMSARRRKVVKTVRHH